MEYDSLFFPWSRTYCLIVLASPARIAAYDHEKQYDEKQQAHHWDVSGLGRSLPEVMAPG